MNNIGEMISDKKKNEISTVVKSKMHILHGDMKNVCNGKKIELITCIGGSEELPSYLLGAYLISGIRGINKIQNSDLDINYYIKINQNISSIINNLDSHKSKEIANFTQEFIHAFIEKYYTCTRNKINVICDTREEALSSLEEVKKFDIESIKSQLSISLLDRIHKRSIYYGNSKIKNRGLEYALLHPIYEGTLNDDKHIVKIGGRPEKDYLDVTKAILKTIQVSEHTFKGAIITKSGKSPLYYPYTGENLYYSNNLSKLTSNKISKKFGLREFDAKILDLEVGLQEYLDFTHSFYHKNSI